MLSREEFFQQLVLRMADTELSPDEILEEAYAIMKRMEKSKYHRKPLEDAAFQVKLQHMVEESVHDQLQKMFEQESERRQTEAQQKASVMTPDVGHYDTGDCLISEVRRHIAANRYAYLKPDVKVYSNGQLPLLLYTLLGFIGCEIRYDKDDPLHRTVRELYDLHAQEPKRLLALIGAIAAMEIDRLTAQEDAVEEYLKTT